MNDKPNIDEFYDHFANVVSHVNPNQVQKLLDCMTPHTYPAGEIILHDGDESDALFFLWEGLLYASINENDETIDLGEIVPGQWVGEVSMLDPGPATATVTTITESTVLKLSRESYLKLERTAPQLVTRLLHGMSNLLAERMRAASDLLYSRHHLPETDKDSTPGGIKRWLVSVYRKMIGITQAA